MKTEEYVTAKVVELLEKAGVPREAIRQGHKMWLGGARPFIADIAIVKDGVVVAVFEIKPQISLLKRIVPHLRGLGLNRYGINYFAIAHDDKNGELIVADVYAINSGEWSSLDKYIETIHQRIDRAFNLIGKNANISTIADYIEAVKLAKNERIMCHHEGGIIKFFYRGHRVVNWKLLPALFRERDRIKTLRTEEEFLLNESERLFPSLFSQCSDMAKLSIAQHYEIPTRLLDVSGNALVALWFAVQSSIDEKAPIDGTVYVFGVSAKTWRTASRLGDTKKRLSKGCLSRATKPQLVFPSFQLPRQKMQDGAFYLFTDDGGRGMCSIFSEDDYTMIVIDKNNKQNLREELEEYCNIHKGVLFPESLADFKDKLVRDAQRRIVADSAIKEVERLRKSHI